jgi:TorA maturation chaperone TorD
MRGKSSRGLGGDRGEAESHIARADLFQLLALFFHLPSPELTRALIDGSVAADVGQILGELDFCEHSPEHSSERESVLQLATAFEVGDLAEEQLLRQLRAEYTRLFTHPERPVIGIYESLFLYELQGRKGERPVLFINAAALDAERLYREAGLARSTAFNESGDHVATQLEFAGFLLRQRAHLIMAGAAKAERAAGSEGPEQETQNTKDMQDAQNVQDMQHNSALCEEFWARHLSKWLLPFGERIIAEAEHPVYRAVGELCVVAAQQGKLWD